MAEGGLSHYGILLGTFLAYQALPLQALGVGYNGIGS